MNLLHKIYLRIIITGCCILVWGTEVGYAQSPSRLIEDLRTLSSPKMEGRKPGTPGHELAKNYILERYKQLRLLPGIKDGYVQPFKINHPSNSSEGYNLAASVKGKKRKQIIVTAHYDHLGWVDGKLYAGADDNASGVSALLYLAEYFSQHQPEHTLLFVALDAEELGLRGARHYAATLNPEDVVLTVNMDMVSRSNRGELYACGTRYVPELKPILRTVNERHEGVVLRFGHDNSREGKQDWTYSSDHGEFYKKGIPFIYFGVEDHPDYHKPGDTFEAIDQEFYSRVVNLILDAVKTIDEKLD